MGWPVHSSPPRQLWTYQPLEDSVRRVEAQFEARHARRGATDDDAHPDGLASLFPAIAAISLSWKLGGMLLRSSDRAPV